jgi:sigma-B regulation protein RsbU (phosphoserine phosphatase)
MGRVKRVLRVLGSSGVIFLITFALFIFYYVTGRGLGTVLTAIALIPVGAIVAFRAMRFIQKHSLWSLRNRLLLVYGLVGILPILLLFLLVALGGWALMNELGIYLANQALTRHVEFVQGAVEAISSAPADQELKAGQDIAKGMGRALPGLALYVKNSSGDYRFPANAPAMKIPHGWKNTDGLLVHDGHFYAWAHRNAETGEITAMQPLTDELVANLVPHLGAIALLERPGDNTSTENRDEFAAAGSFSRAGSDKNPDFRVAPLPAPVNRLDIPVLWPSTIPHYHLETPNRSFPGLLWVYSRPSAVLRTFFSRSEVLRGILYDLVIAVCVLFVAVELAAAAVGVLLARRVTRAVNALYEGTQRVLLGDFRHRIGVTAQDQLGELAESFNRMTGNLERLLAVEKETQRLQTELQIAREVQSQLYPKEAPPMHGLKLTVRCDPARVVSGDYYDYVEIGGRKLAFALGDVAGKGISAALLMATLQAALRAQLMQYQPTKEDECSGGPEMDVSNLISRLNQQIFATTSPEKYATFFFALFDESSRTLTYTNAGHLSPLLFRNGEVIPLDSNGTVVGAFSFAKYEESCLTMRPGDLLLCYTDGITEPENAYGEMFGEERLIDLVRKHWHEEDHDLIRLVLDAVRSWTGQPELHDDMTLMVAREVQPA